MKHPAFIAADIVDAVSKTRRQIIDWHDEIERGIAAAIAEEREAIARMVELPSFIGLEDLAKRIRARGWKEVK